MNANEVARAMRDVSKQLREARDALAPLATSVGSITKSVTAGAARIPRATELTDGAKELLSATWAFQKAAESFALELDALAGALEGPAAPDEPPDDPDTDAVRYARGLIR